MKARQQALLDMSSEGISTTVLFYEKEILELTENEFYRTDFRIINGGHNTHNYIRTISIKIIKLDSYETL